MLKLAVRHHIRIGFAIALATLFALAANHAALAHARLLRSNPEEGAVLEEPPREAHLWFDEPVAIEFSSLDVFDAEGQPIGSASLHDDPTDSTLVIASLPDLSDGIHSLAWKVLSNTDNHYTQGTLVFGIGEPFDSTTRPLAQAEVTLSSLEVALRVLNYAALATLIGSLLVTGVILRPDRFDASLRDVVDAARRRVWRLGFGAAILALIVGAGWLAWQASVVGRGAFDGLLTTRFGGLWLIRQCALFVVNVAMIGDRRGRRWGWLVSVLAIVSVAVSQALNSHAAGLPDQSALAVAADALHLLAAGAWVGSIFALLVGLLPLIRSRRVELVQVALRGWRRFGVFAALSVGALAASGVYNAARQVASIDAWISTTYGQLLAGKIGLFLIAGLIGAINSILLHPRLAAPIAAVLHRPTGWTPFGIKRLPILLVVEAGLVSIILIASSILTAAPPARGPGFEPPKSLVKPPSSLSMPVDDLLVALTIRPNKPGPNIVSIEALNTRRPPPAEILRVMLRLTYRGQDLGQQTLVAEPEDGDTYRLNTSAFGVAGAWQVQVVVRRKGIQDSIADFDWQVESLAPSVPPRPAILSNAPIEPMLTLLAGGLAVCTALAVIGFRWFRPSGSSTLSNIDSVRS